MKKSIKVILINLLFLILYNPLKAQVQAECKNEGEPEDYEAKELFAKYYLKEFFKGFKGKLLVEGDTCRYDSIVVDIFSVRHEFRPIFEKSLFYPGLIAECYKYTPTSEIRSLRRAIKAYKKTDTAKRIIKSNSSVRRKRNDSYIITNFDEVKSIENDSRKKRFRFWMFMKGLANPFAYFMELTNKKATADTDISTFINGAKVTFFKEAWIII